MCKSNQIDMEDSVVLQALYYSCSNLKKRGKLNNASVLLPLCILMFYDFTVNAQAFLQNNASKSCVFAVFFFLYKAFYIIIFLPFCTEIGYLIASNIRKLVAMTPSNYNAF